MLARSWSRGPLSARDCVIGVRRNVRASTELLCDWSPACPATKLAVRGRGAGFEEVELLDTSGSGELGVLGELLDAVDYGGLNGAPAGRFLDVSGWVGVLSVDGKRTRTP